jgi:transcriptional regulator with XRE-family HTH domain
MDEKTSLVQLRQRLQNADPKDDVAFTEILRSAIGLFQLSYEDVADRLNVSRPTLVRWKNGLTHPHPAVRPAIYEWLEQRITEALGAEEQP